MGTSHGWHMLWQGSGDEARHVPDEDIGGLMTESLKVTADEPKEGDDADHRPHPRGRGGAARRRPEDPGAGAAGARGARPARPGALLRRAAPLGGGDQHRGHADPGRPARRHRGAAPPGHRRRRVARAGPGRGRHGAAGRPRRAAGHAHLALPPDARRLPDARPRAADLRRAGARRRRRPRRGRGGRPAGGARRCRCCSRCRPARRTGWARTPATPASARWSGSAGRPPATAAR